MMKQIFQTISNQDHHEVPDAEEEEEVEVAEAVVEVADGVEEAEAETDNESKLCILHDFDQQRVKLIKSMPFNCEI